MTDKMKLVKQIAIKASGLRLFEDDKTSILAFRGNALLESGAGFVNKDFDNSAFPECIIINTIAQSFLQRSPNQQIHSFLHELGHSTGTSKRLNRRMVGIETQEANKEAYALEEIVAESIAMRLMDYFGFHDANTQNRGPAYIFYYLNDFPADQQAAIIKKAGDESDRGVDYILTNWLSETQLKEVA